MSEHSRTDVRFDYPSGRLFEGTVIEMSVRRHPRWIAVRRKCCIQNCLETCGASSSAAVRGGPQVKMRLGAFALLLLLLLLLLLMLLRMAAAGGGNAGRKGLCGILPATVTAAAGAPFCCW